jgi:hypothetical protein
MASILLVLFFGVSLLSEADAQYTPDNQAPQTVKPQMAASTPASIKQWFKSYDEIRRQAQMSPAERARADAMMSKGLSMIVPGEEKVATQELLNSLVRRYQTACDALKALPFLQATGDLHKGYFEYFNDARVLFSDYLKVQSNIFAVDPVSGKPIASQLMSRKEDLEGLDTRNKELDAKLRLQYLIPPYKY